MKSDLENLGMFGKRLMLIYTDKYYDLVQKILGIVEKLSFSSKIFSLNLKLAEKNKLQAKNHAC